MLGEVLADGFWSVLNEEVKDGMRKDEKVRRQNYKCEPWVVFFPTGGFTIYISRVPFIVYFQGYRDPHLKGCP